MEPGFEHQVALLPRGALLRIHAAPGRRIGCVRGMIWLTQQDDPNDRIVSAGESFTFDRCGMALANALGCDAALACERGLRFEHLQTAIDSKRAARQTLSQEIDRIRPRFDASRLVDLPVAARHDWINREAHWMQAQVAWLVVQRIKLALEKAFGAALAKPAAALLQALRESGSKKRGIAAP